jgi:hypothetical protein
MLHRDYCRLAFWYLLYSVTETIHVTVFERWPALLHDTLPFRQQLP